MAKPKLQMPPGRAPGEPPQKIEILRAFMAAGDWRAALKLAASFADLGAEKEPIMRGWEAFARPEFQRALHKDPAALIEAGKAALMRRYTVTAANAAKKEKETR